MNIICNKWVLAATFICFSFTCLSAQPTREQLAQIRVDKDGNFKWKTATGDIPGHACWYVKEQKIKTKP